ncbi:hypothetical protein O7635_06745 [Asanoa sp. WMMD1127]|uniref:hypothetical protein n=1 Tax=Asanoa sp. WMMD1127 TaxID=3016107 RepID=UPI0024160C85|nr:hypothetical protein [Asanoa sp. WMMD1127]MDG4821553.1 hypothetical protein [Asanoa sp. WMMD1127]
MSDALDHLAGPGGDLLARVDDLLARFGAPDDDPVWPLLRRVRALPGEAVAALAVSLRPGPFEAAADAVRARSATFADARATVTAPVAWEGPAGEAFAAHAAALAAGLGEAADKAAATARLADEIAAWTSRTRARLAAALASALGSAEAVAVILGGDAAAGAAAAIATRVLTALDAAITDGETLLDQPRPTGGRRPTGPLPPASYERVTRLTF